MTWADLRAKLNAAMADDAALVVANLELAWSDGDDADTFQLSWSESGPAPADQLVQLVQIGKR